MPSSKEPSIYPVEVQSDFLEKITRARPIQALAELIWNSVDADATQVDVEVEENDLGAPSQVIVRDNGTGIEYDEAPELFKRLGGSWKRVGGTTKDEGRFLHGQDGRGRFKAFALGNLAQWDSAYLKDASLWKFSVVMNYSNIKEVSISPEARATRKDERGITLTVSNLHKDFQLLTSDAGVQQLTEIFALYLADYKHVSIRLNGRKIDPATVIASQESMDLEDIVVDCKTYSVRLDVIEWRSATNRALYLCGEKGMPLAQVERRFHVGPFQFSAYLKSPYISKMQKDGMLELVEMSPTIEKVATEAQAAIRDYFRKRSAQEAHGVVTEWKTEQIYPYQGEAASRVEEVERQVFDIVAVTAAHFIPEFSSAPPKNKALHLRLLRQAIEKSPEELQLILEEVLKLPKQKQEELADLLKDVKLSAIISAAKVVTDRLHFLTGLESILFDSGTKKRLKERSQLHRIIAKNCWLFGEEYNLAVDDQSLTEVLRKHKQKLGEPIVIDEPVKHISKEQGIIDLMLSQAMRRYQADELTHLVVELKAPKVKINQKEITQLEEYAMSVAQDERFRSVNTTWVFWAISDDYGNYAEHRMRSFTGSSGKIHQETNSSIWVKTWAQVLEENRTRMQFFKERLECQADKGDSLKYVQQRYAEFLEGVFVGGDEEESEKTQAKDPGTNSE